MFYPSHREQDGSLEIGYTPVSSLADAHSIRPDQLLAVMRYGASSRELETLKCPVVSIPIPELRREQLVEVWSSASAVAMAEHDGVRYASNGQALFGVCRREEPVGSLLDVLTQAGYKEIFRLLKEEGYRHLLRVWNYFPGINEEQDGLTRYQRFCVGRYHAFADFNPEFENMLPAASVVGMEAPGLLIYFLASREAGMPVENPRQVSAYRYPPRYSPRSPSFCRAMAKDWGRRCHLYVSGTASIVGHDTHHVGQVQAQSAEVLRNIQALLEQAARVTGTDFRRGSEALLKVYIRRAADFPVVRETVVDQLGDRVCVLYLQGDLCRADLLVEIEAIYAR